jgi:hypothetical protein
VKDTSATHPPEDSLLTSYSQLAKGLIGHSTGICLFDDRLQPRGCTPDLNLAWIERWVKTLRWTEAAQRTAAAISPCAGQWLTAMPLQHSDGVLLGVFCIQEARQQAPTKTSQYARETQHALKPLMDCVQREMAAALPAKSRIQALTERTTNSNGCSASPAD